MSKVKMTPSEALVETMAAELPEVAESEVVRHFVRLSNLNHHVDKTTNRLPDALTQSSASRRLPEASEALSQAS